MVKKQRKLGKQSSNPSGYYFSSHPGWKKTTTLGDVCYRLTLGTNSSDDVQVVFECLDHVGWLVTKTKHKFNGSDFVSIYQQIGIRISNEY